jgi:hypothetical protein
MSQRVKSETARATIIEALDIERERSGAEYTRATQECNRANDMTVKHTEGQRSQKLARESMEVELVDMRKQVSVANSKIIAIEQQEQVAAEIQMQLFEHSLLTYKSPFVYMTSAELAEWFARKIPTVDSTAKPSPEHWGWTAERFASVSGFDMVRQTLHLTNKQCTTWIKNGPADNPLPKEKRLTARKAIPIKLCLEAMQFGWARRLWVSLKEGANPLMDYMCVRKLGAGAFGEAFLVKSRHSNKLMAIKFVNCEHDIDLIKDVIKETELQQTAVSPFVATVETWKVVDRSFFWVLMESCDGGELSPNLFGEVRDAVDEPTIWVWISQLITALRDMHKAGIVHRDMKPEVSQFGYLVDLSTPYCVAVLYMLMVSHANTPH